MNLKKNFITLFFLLPFFLFSQDSDTIFIKMDLNWDDKHNYTIDTLFVKSVSDLYVLHGTTILPLTNGQNGALNYGIKLKDIYLTPCENNGRPPENHDPIVNSISISDSLWQIDIKVVSNCCHNFLGDLEITDNNTLNLLYYPYGGFCSCYCCFGLTYIIEVEDFMKEETDKLKVISVLGKSNNPLKNY
jgi:hypothetical protein